MYLVCGPDVERNPGMYTMVSSYIANTLLCKVFLIVLREWNTKGFH